jgi:diacylglycerol O-acyltransferase
VSRYLYERLSAESASFLQRETPRLLGHSACLLVFDPGPLARPDGGVDFQTIRRSIEARLHEAPRFRQKLAWIPFEGHPVWVDDRDFRLDYHLRHTSLPRPGTREQLESTAARLLSQRLDRSRPPWECWVLEGLEDGRFAILLKTHLCMVDDVTRADLMRQVLSPEPHVGVPAAVPFVPRPRPSARELALDEIVRQASLPRRLTERVSGLLRDSARLDHELRSGLRGLAALLGYSVRQPAESPLNGRIGPHRTVTLFRVSLAEARAVATALGGTVHDAILATATGGLRSFLRDRLVSPAALDLRVATPIGLWLRAGDAPGARRTVEWVVDLPVWEPDPRARFAAIRDRTRDLASRSDVAPARRIAGEGSWPGARFLALGARALAGHTPVNLTVTNVPGPREPLYFAGSSLQESFGLLPLREHHGLGIAVLSYRDELFWGLNGDLDLLPDLRQLGTRLQEAFHELRDAAAPILPAISTAS